MLNPTTPTHHLRSTRSDQSAAPALEVPHTDETPPGQGTPTEAHTPATIRVILVDTNVRSLERHHAYITNMPNYAIDTVASNVPQVAHRILQNHSEHDLLVIGVTHPHCTELSLIRQIRARNICTPVIATSTNRSLEIVNQALALGALDYLLTPIAFPMFAQRLNQARKYCEWRTNLAFAPIGQKMSQYDIDEVLSAHHPRLCSSRHTGLAPETLKLIHEALLTAPHSTASDIAIRTHTSRVTARRYLEHLANIGLAYRTLQHGTTGRPKSVYTSAQ